MLRLITRRQFSLAAGSLALVGATRRSAPAQVTEDKSLGIQRGQGGIFLQAPHATEAGETWRYGLAVPFQLAARTAAAFCNIRLSHPPSGAYEIGTDVVIFDGFGNSGRRQIVPVSRAHQEPNPKSDPPGNPAVLLKYPVRGGFVPLGAKRADGSPHPHAGSGFGLIYAMAWPIYTRQEIQAATDNLPPYVGHESHTYYELQQYAYDGKQFRVTSTERLTHEELLSGWRISDFSITNAIPDGDDLLFSASAENRAGERSAGVSTWSRGPRGWRPTSFVPVTGGDRSSEASLVRDVDGGLLFCARGTREDTSNNLRVWRAERVERTWKQVINIAGVVAGPISINQTADGTVYLASNLYQVALFRLEPRWITIIGPGLVRRGGWLRETLCLWPLNAGRDSVDIPIVLRDSRAEFGPPPDGSYWLVDHPAAATVQLADGAWHNVLGYRITTRGEISNYGSDPTPHSGGYLEELHSPGRPVPVWRF